MTDHIRDHVLKPSMSPFQPQRSLEEFFNAFDLPRIKDIAGNQDRADRYFVLYNMIREEFFELRDEINEFEISEGSLGVYGDPSRARLAKEMADLVYVVFQLAEATGINLERVFREVHGSNMSKLGPDGKPVKRHDGKVLKGPDYKEPDLAKLVA